MRLLWQILIKLAAILRESVIPTTVTDHFFKCFNGDCLDEISFFVARLQDFKLNTRLAGGNHFFMETHKCKR